MTRVVLDAAAYRALTKSLDAAAARDAARALVEGDGRRGLRGAASPFALWSLLADVAASVAPPARGERAPSEQARERAHERAGRARVALAACAIHAAKDRGAPGTHPFLLLDDPESRLCAALGLQAPPGLAAWNEYLASLAAELAEEPTQERAQRLAAPLAHVGERARSIAEDYADEMQDAVLGAYDAASDRWDWTDAMTDDARQQALAGPLAPEPYERAPEGAIGEPLLLDVLRRDPLLRAVAVRRAARAHRLVAGAATGATDAATMLRAGETVDAEAEPTLDEAACVAEVFPAGLTLAREVLRRVIAGDLEMAGRAARRWLWDLHVALGLRDERGVTGAPPLIDAVAGVPGMESIDAYRHAAGA